MQFYQNLSRLRAGQEISQEELARRIGVSADTVYDWESARVSPDIDQLIALSKYFGVTTDALLGIEAAPQPEYSRDIRFSVQSSMQFEYKSQLECFGLPLLHIHFGNGLARAKGIIAIGNVACGLISIGLFSFGILSFGCISLGLIALGAVAAGLLAIGAVAIGGIAIGALAIGIYSLGACAIAAEIGIGDLAVAKLAIGNETYGKFVFSPNHRGIFDIPAILSCIHEHMNYTPPDILRLLPGILSQHLF